MKKNKIELLKNLINRYSDNQIIETIIELYPNQKNSKKGYKKVLEELRNKPTIQTNLSIVLTKVKDEDGNYVHVYGLDNNKKEWAIEYTAWGEWINMEIEIKSYKKYKKLEIIAHCLWEMTWSGFSDKWVQTAWDKLKSAK